MDLRDKRKNEVDHQKELRKEEVIQAAITVFKENGIENTKMTDIAKSAEVGVASIYRYFKTKPELVIEVAIRAWEITITAYLKDFDQTEYIARNGIQRVEALLSVFLTLYKEHKEFLRFIEEFDNYMIKEKISPDRLAVYEKTILNLMPFMMDALEKGKKDGSIKPSVHSEEFYMTLTHALISLCQKLISRNFILTSDQEIDGESQVKLMIDMAIHYISNGTP
ncbi:TetR/AcrR family transcriptional regulator [Gorillibacterium sp. CAU 1737]|uniref:TetR/AcrR family transcriptional regulator n=1 Tax=Gorillibacterium sp. CAU 1737 TaxID=3140362 RepID=UPI003260F9AC